MVKLEILSTCKFKYKKSTKKRVKIIDLVFLIEIKLSLIMALRKPEIC